MIGTSKLGNKMREDVGDWVDGLQSERDVLARQLAVKDGELSVAKAIYESHRVRLAEEVVSGK